MDQSDIECLFAPIDGGYCVFDENHSNSICFSQIVDGGHMVDVHFSFPQLDDQIFIDQPASISDESSLVEPQSLPQAKRADNTIFKTSLGQYRKSIIDELKSDSRLSWLRTEIKKIYRGVKNLSVFPKLNALVRQLNISQQISSRWTQRSRQLLQKKQTLVRRGKYSNFRLEELKRSIEAMNFCMNEPLFDVGFQMYWGKFKQTSRHDKSKQDVLNFRQYFKNLLKRNTLHAETGTLADRNISGDTQEEHS